MPKNESKDEAPHVDWDMEASAIVADCDPFINPPLILDGLKDIVFTPSKMYGKSIVSKSIAKPTTRQC